MAYTVADMINLLDQNIGGIALQVQKNFPLIGALQSETVLKTSANYPVVTALPAGEFRTQNAGKTNNSATITTVPIDLKYFDASWILDEMVAQADSNGVEAAISFATEMALKGAFKGLESQIIYGDKDTSGFDGLVELLTNISGVEVDAGGSTPDIQTSVWALNTDSIKITLGNEGRLTQGPVAKQLVTDADGKGYWAYVQNLALYSAVKAIDTTSFGRIVNLDLTKTLDDDMIYDLLSQLDNANLIVMNRRSAKQLRQSRTATNATGAAAPFVTNLDGIPVIITDSITNTEAVVGS